MKIVAKINLRVEDHCCATMYDAVYRGLVAADGGVEKLFFVGCGGFQWQANYCPFCGKEIVLDIEQRFE